MTLPHPRLTGLIFVLLLVLTGGLYSVRVYNKFQLADEKIKDAWSNLERLYQRRSELVPALVEVLRHHARQESNILRDVAEAHVDVSRLGSMPSLPVDTRLHEQYMAAQQHIESAIPRLLSIAERYPALRSSAAYLDLQIRLEGMENRLAYARWKYIDALANYNSLARQFPSSLLAQVFNYVPVPVFDSATTVVGNEPPAVPRQTP